jgi:hypothetical protein
MIEHLDLASEALKAFSLYAEKMERLPQVTDVLVLRLHSDGSGRICSNRESRIIYLSFASLKDLLTQLKQSNI